MRSKAVLSLAGAALLASMGAASAGLLVTPNGGSVASATPEASSPFPTSLSGYAGPALLTAQSTANYLFTYRGVGDPAFTNTFTVTGCAGAGTFTDYVTPVGSSFTCSFAAGTAIAFRFTANSGANTVNAGAPYANGLGYLIAMTNSSTAGDTAYIGLSDGGTTSDADFQDMVVTVSQIPEPAGLAMVGVALAGLALARRQQARPAARRTPAR